MGATYRCRSANEICEEMAARTSFDAELSFPLEFVALVTFGVAHYDFVAVEPVDSWSKIFAENLHNPLARATVPQWWNRSLLSSSLENLCQLGIKQPRVLPNQ